MTEPTFAALRRAAAGLLVVAAFGASSCDERLHDVTGPSPDLQPTFTSIQAEIFDTTDLAGRTSCLTCHTDQARTPTGNLNLRADRYAALVNVPSKEKPGLRMPRNGPPYLTAGQIPVIGRWIETGAARY
jgi:hypothetical protein